MDNQQVSNHDKALQIARGTYQRAIVNGEETLGGSTLRGKAKSYSGRYAQSARSLLSRLDAAGIPYKIHAGPRGGWYSATLEIVE